MRTSVSYTLVLDCSAFVVYFNDNEDYLVEPIDKGEYCIEPRGYNQVFVLDSNQNFVCLTSVRESNLVSERISKRDYDKGENGGGGLNLEASALLFKSMFSGSLGGSKPPPKPSPPPKLDIEIV